MKSIDIIVMGKTGAGKSTLINAVLKENVAPTGIGQAVTKKNQLYSKGMLLPVRNCVDEEYSLIRCMLNMYDTVGLEIDNTITDKTLAEIKEHIEITKKVMNPNSIHLVWFCVNNRSSRFESYELELIRKLSIEYEIPFIIVLTQCLCDEDGELENQIRNNLPEVTRCRVLARDYFVRAGKISAYGITDLINTSINNYKSLKVHIIERKLNELDERKKQKITQIEEKGKQIISSYSSAAFKISFVPGGCIPIVHGMCIKMIADLNDLAGFKSGYDFAEDIFANVIVGIIATPLMVVPFLSIAVATAYIESVGENYLKSMISVIHLSSDKDLENMKLIKKRLKEELKKLK